MAPNGASEGSKPASLGCITVRLLLLLLLLLCPASRFMGWGASCWPRCRAHYGIEQLRRELLLATQIRQPHPPLDRAEPGNLRRGGGGRRTIMLSITTCYR